MIQDKKSFWQSLGATAWLAVIVLLVVAAGCNKHLKDNKDDNDNYNNNNYATALTRVSSVGYIAALTSEVPSAQDDFAPRAWDAVYDIPFSGGVGIVTGSEDLEVSGPSNLEVWEVPTDKVSQFETLIRTYLTHSGWVPDLFPTSLASAGDLKVMLTTFACGVELPEFAPSSCPAEWIPPELFRRVATGYLFWRNPGTTKVVFLVRR